MGGGFSLGEVNAKGESILQFLSALDLTIENSLFRKEMNILSHIKMG